MTLAKVASAPADPSSAVMAGLEKLAGLYGLSRRGLLKQTLRIVHGTTVATNALLERKAAPVALLTTEGHTDVLAMREGLKDDRYNLRMTQPEPLAPKHLRLPVRERMGPDGKPLIPLDQASLKRAIAGLKKARVESVAVCFLHSHANARHERLAAEAVRKALPGVSVSLSSNVLPRIKEFQRFSTTAVDAYAGRAVGAYLGKLDQRLKQAGYRGPCYVTLSHGGVAPLKKAARQAAATVLSGPAGGAAGAVQAATLLGAPDLIAFDMGGTSTDIALITGGRPGQAQERRIGGELIALPSLDISTLGAGGGSIARVDAGGFLTVGPESAGAIPGPACYGRGGTLATVTDALCVLGLIAAAKPLGDGSKLDPAAALAAVTRLAKQLRLSPLKAAAGIVTLVETQMAEGIRLASVKRGIDPRRHALLAFGGAAGLHACGVAARLGITRVIAPQAASVFSAWGMLAADIRCEASRTHLVSTQGMDAAGTRKLFDGLERQARAELGKGFKGRIRAERFAEMRYGEQIFETDVPLEGLDWESRDLGAAMAELFHRRHEELFTYALRGREAVLVNARAAVIGGLPQRRREPALRASRRPAAPSIRGSHPVWQWEALPPGSAGKGYAVIESALTSILVPEGWQARVTSQGWLDMIPAAAPRQAEALTGKARNGRSR